MTERNRAYCFTWNNYPSDLTPLQNIECDYMVYGHEIAPTTGTPHLQGYMYNKNKFNFKKIAKDFVGIHLIPANGTAEQNYTYCTKDKTDVFEKGTKPKQGKRNDLAVIREAVADGKRMSDIIYTGSNFQSIRCAELLYKYIEPKRDWKPDVTWICGKTGIGKTKRACEIFNNPADRYIVRNYKWWQGYDAHPDVILDDLRADSLPFISFITMLDPNEYFVEHKGGSRQLLAKRMIITSKLPPEELFRDLCLQLEEDVVQVSRRIDRIIFM